jgi:hypothetical protein
MSPDRIYEIYGLRVRSELPLQATRASSDGAVDLEVRGCNAMPRPTTPQSLALTIDWRQVGDGWRLRFQDSKQESLEFTFDRKATQLDIRSTLPDLTGDIAAVLIGPALAAALHLRGIPMLHASAVAVDGKAILVAGPAGAGKSTLTAALVARGAALLAEDLAVLTFEGKDLFVQAGSPCLRLCPDATLVAGRAAADLPRVFSVSVPDDKRWVHAADLLGGFRATPAPLAGIYLLAPRNHDRSVLKIIPLPPHRAGLALLAHFYGARWLHIPELQALEWCTQISSRASAQIVHAPPGLELVGETAAAIIAHARCKPPSQSTICR